MDLRSDVTVVDLVALSLLHCAELKDGTNAWVTSFASGYTLEKNSGAVADGINIIQPIAGSASAGATGARWILSSASQVVAAANMRSFAIYQQGAPAPAVPPVYGSFAAAFAALGPGGVLYIDPTLGQPVTTPGVYDLNGITLAGFWPGLIRTNLDIVTGTTFTNMGIVSALRLTTKSANPVIIGSQNFWLQQYAGIVVDPTAGAPFYLSGAGDNIFVGMSNVSYLWSQKPGIPCLETGAGTVSAVMDLEQSQIQSNSIGGVVNWALQVESPSSVIDLTQLGPYTLALYAKSQFVGYTPGIPGNWLVAPTETAQALDELAAAGKLFSIDLTLVGGTKTVASGKDLTNATLLSVRLKTPITATGQSVVAFVAGVNGNVTVTSYGPTAAQVNTDASTYTCVFAGVV